MLEKKTVDKSLVQSLDKLMNSSVKSALCPEISKTDKHGLVMHCKDRIIQSEKTHKQMFLKGRFFPFSFWLLVLGFTGKRQEKESKKQLETLCFTINPCAGKDKFLPEFIKQLGPGLRFTQPPFPTSKFFLPGYESLGKLELNLFSQYGQDLCLLSPKMLKV